MTYSKSLKPGFSIIELMVALLIIGVIAGMIGPRVMGFLTKGKKTSTENTLKVVKDAIKQYKMTVGKYPETLNDLVKKPEDENITGWDGPYVGSEDSESPAVPTDAWNEPLKYQLNPRGSTPPFTLYSLGDPDKDDDKIYAK